MEGSLALRSVAVLAAFGCALFLMHAILGVLGKRPRAAAYSIGSERGKSGWFSWLVRNGVGIMRPAARLALRSAKVRATGENVLAAAEGRGFAATEESVLSLVLAAMLVVGVGGAALTAAPICGVALAFCVAAACAVCAKSSEDKRRERMREAVPDALRSMAVCFRSGQSLLQTMQQVGAATKGPVGALFQCAVHLLETGGSTREALSVFQGRNSVPELAFVSVALDVQHQTGGSMERVLDAARETVEGELELTRSLRVQTAQAKLSARIVSVMPIVLVALFSLVSEDFLGPFFSSFPGMALLCIAVAMQVAGIVSVRHMLKVEVE